MSDKEGTARIKINKLLEAAGFAVPVTSQIPDAQQFTINFANNNLLGSGNFLPGYKTSKARVCVTVGMMTTSP